MKNAIMVTDLHLTDRKADEYRFGLFPWLHQKVKKYDAQLLMILGDITDNKDYHSGVLVNRIVDNLNEMRQRVEILVLRGNHDGDDPTTPFFKFLNSIDGIDFIIDPTEDDMFFGKSALFIPHQRNKLPSFNASQYDYIFMHQTFKGARSEAGAALSGHDASVAEGVRIAAFSGDVHVPQHVGPVEYIGAPYHVHFGDKFDPRCVLLDVESGKKTNLRFDTVRKHSLRIRHPDDLKRYCDRLVKGDQVKVWLKLTKSEIFEWEKHKRAVQEYCAKLGVSLYGVEIQPPKRARLREDTPEGNDRGTSSGTARSVSDDFHQFCTKSKLDNYTVSVGKAMVEECASSN